MSGKNMHTHYWISVSVESAGIILVFTGLIELFFFDCHNPTNFLITLGSFVFAIGSGLMAKWVKRNWRHG